MKNFYHYTLAMLYLKIARLYSNRFEDPNIWGKMMDRSVAHIRKVKP